MRTFVIGAALCGVVAILSTLGACSATTNNQFGTTEGGGGAAATSLGTGGGNTSLASGTGGDNITISVGTGSDTTSSTGTGTQTVTNCDKNLSLTSTNPVDGAAAIGICKQSTGPTDWGLVSAKYMTAGGKTLPAGAEVGYGILGNFGSHVHPQEGLKMLALSSGTARNPNDPGYDDPGGSDKGYGGGAPTGFPKESPACPGVQTGDPHDSVALEIQMIAPTDAKSFSFNLNFYTFEFPSYICSEYNDFFVAIQTPAPAGASSGNISFDSKGNLISVNAGFLQVCQAQTASDGTYFPCPLGATQLQGTGFDQPGGDFGETENSAATGWLQTTSSVTGGSSFTLRFAVWDSGDGVLSSTTLIDNFKFDQQPADTTTTPITMPK